MNRIDRLLAIVLELQARDRITAAQLADIFEISQRTVYRDIRALNETGVPIVSAPGQGYWLMEGYFLPPISFSATETTMLILGANYMQQHFDEQYQEAASTAIRKIEAVLKPELQSEVNYIRQNIRFFSSRSSDATNIILAKLRRAIIEHKKVAFNYIKRYGKDKDKAIYRTVNPHSLFSLNDIWMLQAFCNLRQGMRLFRLDRIEDFEILTDGFKREENYSIREQRTDFPATAKLLFKKSMKRWIKESPSYFISSYEETDTDLIVTLKIRNIGEIIHWVLAWGNNVIVLEPDELKQELLKVAAHYQDNYKS